MIQWYPGHMAKTKKIITENLKHIDIALHIIDARIPKSSYNPLLERILGSKPQIIVFNKADLADSSANKKWIMYYNDKGINIVETNAKNRQGIDEIFKTARDLMRNRREKLMRVGYVNVPIRLMILGVPNVGKSTLINAMVGSTKAKVGNKPGITKGKQWIRIGDEFEYMDTPGILWPKFEDEMTGYMLALVGSINDDLLDFEELSLKFIERIVQRYPEVLLEKYKLDRLSDDNYTNLINIGKKRGCLIKGGEVDTLKAAKIVIDDFRSGRLGNITLELPEDIGHE